jgi:outer membrane biogenesis lipoprotein LolB
VALAGAFSFGASVPVDHLTDWAAADRGAAAASAAAETAFKTSRRFQD